MTTSTSSTSSAAPCRVYYGQRLPCGCVSITADGSPLAILDIPYVRAGHVPSPDWGARTVGTAVLSYSLLADALGGDLGRAAWWYQRFSADVLAVYPRGSFHSTANWIRGWVERQERFEVEALADGVEQLP